MSGNANEFKRLQSKSDEINNKFQEIGLEIQTLKDSAKKRLSQVQADHQSIHKAHQKILQEFTKIKAEHKNIQEAPQSSAGPSL